MVDADDLFAAGLMDFDDRLVFAGKLELRRTAMMAGPCQNFETQFLEEFDMRINVSNDKFHMVDGCNHFVLPINEIYVLNDLAGTSLVL
jgi:hypothetical protein